MKRYTVRYERDEEGWWVASAVGLKGCHTQGRSIEEARRHIREAIAALLNLSAEEERGLSLRDDVKLPAEVKRLLSGLEKARRKADQAKAEVRRTATRAAQVLTKRHQLSRRDIAAITGYSFQRIHQLTHQGK